MAFYIPSCNNLRKTISKANEVEFEVARTLTITSRRGCCLRHNSLSRVTNPCSRFCTSWSTIRLRRGAGSTGLTAVFQRLPFPCVHLRNWEKREWSLWKFKYFSQVRRSRLNYYWRISPIENTKLELPHIVEYGTILYFIFFSNFSLALEVTVTKQSTLVYNFINTHYRTILNNHIISWRVIPLKGELSHFVIPVQSSWHITSVLWVYTGDLNQTKINAAHVHSASNLCTELRFFCRFYCWRTEPVTHWFYFHQ